MSLESICNIIQEEYNKQAKGILTEEFIDKLFTEYKTEKVLYCLKSYFDVELELELETDIKYTLKDIRDDNYFRTKIKNKFKKCIICDNCPEYTYQVAHIWNYKDCKTSAIDAYNINNGLLMCANTHILFDNNILQIKPVLDCELNSSDEYLATIIINENEAREYYKYNNKQICLNYENIKYLEKRYSIL